MDAAPDDIMLRRYEILGALPHVRNVAFGVSEVIVRRLGGGCSAEVQQRGLNARSPSVAAQPRPRQMRHLSGTVMMLGFDHAVLGLQWFGRNRNGNTSVPLSNMEVSSAAAAYAVGFRVVA